MATIRWRRKMAVRPVLEYPDPRLLQKTAPVEDVQTDAIQTLIDDMLETMYDQDGAGLAAPQVGANHRILVIDLSRDRSEPLCLINPEIVEREGSQSNQEGCLSFPGIWIDVERANWVHMKALDRNSKPIEIKTDGFLAIAIQHEIDHLDGIVFINRLSGLKRQRAMKKFDKAKRLRTPS